jgi:hypothetical protein
MNWGIVMYGGVIIFSTIYYVFWGRHTYRPPTEETKRAIAAFDLTITNPEAKGGAVASVKAL